MELITARGLAAEGVVYALMEGDKGTFLYATDPIDTRIEELFHVDKIKSSESAHRGRHFLERLVTQPLGRMWWDRAPRPLVATHTEIGVVNDAASHVNVATQVDLLAMRPSVGIWRSSLRDRVISTTNKDLPNTVTSVKVNGKPADFVHLGSQLLVAIDPPAEAGATTRIEVANQGNIAIRPGSGRSWTLGTWAWHPDPGLNGDMSTSIITLEVPKDLVPFASGTMVSTTTGEVYDRLEDEARTTDAVRGGGGGLVPALQRHPEGAHLHRRVLSLRQGEGRRKTDRSLLRRRRLLLHISSRRPIPSARSISSRSTTGDSARPRRGSSSSPRRPSNRRPTS